MEVITSINSQTSFENSKKILNDKGLVVIDYPNHDLYLVKYEKSLALMAFIPITQFLFILSAILKASQSSKVSKGN